MDISISLLTKTLQDSSALIQVSPQSSLLIRVEVVKPTRVVPLDVNDQIIFQIEIMHSGEKGKLAICFTSFTPKRNMEEIKRLIEFFLEDYGIDLHNVQLDKTPISGYPEEMSRMRKRKILEYSS